MFFFITLHAPFTVSSVQLSRQNTILVDQVLGKCCAMELAGADAEGGSMDCQIHPPTERGGSRGAPPPALLFPGLLSLTGLTLARRKQRSNAKLIGRNRLRTLCGERHCNSREDRTWQGVLRCVQVKTIRANHNQIVTVYRHTVGVPSL